MPKGVLDCEGAVQTYAWGKKGLDSKVAQLAQKYKGAKIQDSERYAELWLGTHPKGPLTIKGTGQTLSDWLKENEWALGDKVRAAYGDVPFIFKVLSIAQALSIQAHPTKELAAQLRASNPKEYPDDNHKPEMCVTLTDFEGLMGFRPLTEIAEVLRHHPEVAAAVGQKHVDAFLAAIDANPKDAVDASKAKNSEPLRAALKDVFSGLMHASDDTIARELTKLVERLAAADPSTLSPVDKLCLRVEKDYPNDVGCFCVYLLNYVTLAPGESMFMAANEPHAYLSGDTLECMSRSDNVVRSGLTPKFKDVETLVTMLTYDYGPGANKVLSGKPVDKVLSVYKPPIEEFTIAVANVAASQAYTFPGVAGPSIFLCYQGSGKVEGDGGFDVGFGSVVFVAADTELTVAAGAQGLTLSRAYCEL